ncbi:MAG: universal stress protein [Desulfobulbaceae bacterium]
MKTMPEIKTILYASDLGKFTRPVFRQAVAQANIHNAKLIMLHVIEPLNDTARAVISAWMPEKAIEEIQKDKMQEIIAHMKERVTKFSDEECDGAGIDKLPLQDIVVVTGRPSEEILLAAEKYHADLIVMGQSSKKVLGSKVMGSSARRVARLSPVPVLIVPNM